MMRTLTAIGVVVVLGACAQPQKSMSAEEAAWQQKMRAQIAVLDAQRVPTADVSMGCAGHGKVGYIHSYAVEEPVYGQISRGMVSGLSCGGISAGGYTLPVKWTPNMKVKVRWNRPIKGEDNWLEKTTAILPYDKPGMLVVHFFPNDEVRVVVSNYYSESPNHPLPQSLLVPPPEPD